MVKWFSRKKEGFVDLTGKYKRDKEKLSQTTSSSEASNSQQSSQGAGNAFGFFGAIASSSGSENNSNSSDYLNVPGSASSMDLEERRRKSDALPPYEG